MNGWVLLQDWLSPAGIISLGVIYAGFQAWRSKRASLTNAKALAEVKERVAVVQNDVNKIEVGTNSMKDALVEATAKASRLEGEIAGREDEVARQASKE